TERTAAIAAPMAEIVQWRLSHSWLGPDSSTTDRAMNGTLRATATASVRTGADGLVRRHPDNGATRDASDADEAGTHPTVRRRQGERHPPIEGRTMVRMT